MPALPVALQVPLDADLNITDDTRIRAAIPTLKYLLDNGAKVGAGQGCSQSADWMAARLGAAPPAWLAGWRACWLGPLWCASRFADTCGRD